MRLLLKDDGSQGGVKLIAKDIPDMDSFRFTNLTLTLPPRGITTAQIAFNLIHIDWIGQAKIDGMYRRVHIISNGISENTQILDIDGNDLTKSIRITGATIEIIMDADPKINEAHLTTWTRPLPLESVI